MDKNKNDIEQPSQTVATKEKKPENRRPREEIGKAINRQRSEEKSKAINRRPSEDERKRENRQRREEKRGYKGKKQSKKVRRRNGIIKMAVYIAIALGVMIGILAFMWNLFQGPIIERYEQYLPAIDERADLQAHFDIRRQDELGLILDNQIIRDREDGTGVRYIDGVPYLEFSLLRQHVNRRFHWDYKEQLLLYTLPTGTVRVTPNTRSYLYIEEETSTPFVILRIEGDTPFVALPFIAQFSNIEYEVFAEPGRLSLRTDFGEQLVRTVESDSYLRAQGSPRSPILTELAAGQEVYFVEDVGSWQRVLTADGFVGYAEESALGAMTVRSIENHWEEPIWTNIVRDHPIHMTWNDIHHPDANGFLQETLDRTHGLTAIAPTWVSIRDTQGNLDSLASVEYVELAHAHGLEVWVTIRDFHGGIDSFHESYLVLSRTSNRERIIEQLIAETLRVGADGINLDFEKIDVNAGSHFIQFVRELSVVCREHQLLFSIANLPPFPWNAHYDLEEQGIVADYIIIMGYDEFFAGSLEAGPVASFNFTRFNIETALTMVPAERLINAVPFYSRLWLQTPKTEEELAAQAGTQEGNYNYHVSSVALGMNQARAVIDEAGVEPIWDTETRMYYASWETPDGLQRIWLEDARSLREKLEFMYSLNLAGVGSWQVVLGNESAWDVIAEVFSSGGN